MKKATFDNIYDDIKAGKIGLGQLYLAYSIYKKHTLSEAEKAYVRDMHSKILSGEITKEDAESRWMGKI